MAERLHAAGHDALTPAQWERTICRMIELATAQQRVIVTENAADFAHVTTCVVLFVRKSWWPAQALAPRLTEAVDRWAMAYPDPGTWPHWVEAELR